MKSLKEIPNMSMGQYFFSFNAHCSQADENLVFTRVSFFSGGGMRTTNLIGAEGFGWTPVLDFHSIKTVKK